MKPGMKKIERITFTVYHKPKYGPKNMRVILPNLIFDLRFGFVTYWVAEYLLYVKKCFNTRSFMFMISQVVVGEVLKKKQ